MSDEMIPLVRQHLVAISAHYGGKLRHHATGALVRFADHFFVLTAAHAIEDFDKGREHYSDLELYIDNGDSSNIIPLYGHYHATQIAREPGHPRLRLAGERDDFWDIGLWELDRRTVDALTTKRFLSRANISLTQDLAKGVYFLAGCPCSWAHADSAAKSAHWKWLRYTAHPYPEWAELPNFDQRFHIALCLGDGPALPTAMQGISGCPIWKLSDLPVAEDWTPEQAQIVAVQTHVYTDRALKAIRGTKWRYVLQVLVDMHPDIREVFKLWIPGSD
jgi:hypothetical protein